MASVPLEESGAFKSQFGLVVTNGHFDLPTTGISQDDLPGKLRSISGLGSEEIPGRLVLPPSDHQPKGLLVGRIEDRKGNDTGFAFALVAGIPEQAVVPGAFALGNLTWFAWLSLFIEQVVVFRPAQDKASPSQKGLCQPGIACKAAIPDM